MSTSLKLDDDNNLLYSNSGFLIAEGDEALAQDVRNRLRLYKKEYFINPDLGISYQDELQKPNKNSILFDIQRELKKDTRIRNYDLKISVKNRKMYVDINIITREGREVNV